MSVSVIKIPVTPLTVKALIFSNATTSEGVIIAKKGSLLFENLSKTTSLYKKNVRANKNCTEVIQLQVPFDLASHIHLQNPFLLGYMLHKFEIEQLLNTIEFAVFHLKHEAMGVIENYFAARNINEDDFQFETIYKAWQRRKEKKVLKSQLSIRTKTYTNVFNCSYIPLVKINRYFEAFYGIKMSKFCGPKLKFTLIRQRKVMLFLTYKLSNTSLRELANQYKIHYQQLHTNIKVTEYIFNNFDDDVLSIMINEALDFIKQEVSPLQISLK